jgi:hypothetical protein
MGGRGRIEQQGSHALSERRAAGLAGEDCVDAPRLQPIGQQARLRGLAGALAALERDELAGCHGRRRPVT